jgi:hypothetical protein
MIDLTRREFLATAAASGLVLTSPARAQSPKRGGVLRFEKLRTEWMRATDSAKRKQLAEQIQVVAFDEVPYITWGQYVQPSVYRKTVRGVLQFPANILWNVWLDA